MDLFSTPQSPRPKSNRILRLTKAARSHQRFRGTNSAHGQTGWSRPVLIQVPSREPSALTTVRDSNSRLLLGRQGPNLSDNGGWSDQRELPPRFRLGKPTCL